MTENRYTEGATVYALSHPNEKLIVRRYIKRIYYCTAPNDPEQKDQALFESEITDVANQAAD